MGSHIQVNFNSEIQLILLIVFAAIEAVTWSSHAAESPSPKELLVGFKATTNPSVSSFQPLLTDSSGNYSLGFLRVNRNQLSLSVLHVPSSTPLWSAGTTRLARWADPTQLFFNGSLVLSDSHTGLFWSTHTTGDRVWLSNNSNLIVQNPDAINIPWQSFDFPSDTLVESQIFTSTMTLVSSNGLYSLRLGSNFMGLYAKFVNSDKGPGQIYLKHRALEAKASIVEGRPIYLVLEPEGYFGMFQSGPIPVDVQPFNTFQRNVPGIHRVRIEPDGNLRGYYWTGTSWILDYQVISESCELPSHCGPYGLCNPGKECSCLDNRTAHGSGGCSPPQSQISSDFCGAYDHRFWVLRRSGVDLPFKELIGYQIMASNEQCEDACAGNCTCWGVVYSNSSGFCYMLDYPLQTLVAVKDESKTGYFKVREGVGKKKVGTWLALGFGLLFGAILVFGGALGLGWYKWKWSWRGVKGYEEEEDVVGIGPYKNLEAASFGAIELCER